VNAVHRGAAPAASEAGCPLQLGMNKRSSLLRISGVLEWRL